MRFFLLASAAFLLCGGGTAQASFFTPKCTQVHESARLEQADIAGEGAVASVVCSCPRGTSSPYCTIGVGMKKLVKGDNVPLIVHYKNAMRLGYGAGDRDCALMEKTNQAQMGKTSVYYFKRAGRDFEIIPAQQCK